MNTINGKRHRQVIWPVLIAAVVSVLLLSHSRVRATNHDVHIKEVMAGANGNSKIQFIVIEREGPGQILWGPVTGEVQSRAMLVFFDAAGNETGKFKFPANPPDGGFGPSGTPFTLIATSDFANLPGAPRPDVTIPPLLNPINGKVCFKNNPANTAFTRNECLSYGSFTGDTESNSGDGVSIPAGPPAAALPIMNTVSLRRTLDTDQNSDFAITTAPAPSNTAGATFTISVASPVSQGESLFNNETFGGNGRTCASCHVASLSGRLTPDNVQSRFATLTPPPQTPPAVPTYDPQFIAETAPSSFDPGFDFNLNTLVLTAEVASNAPCTGELRGPIDAGSAHAKVLTRVSSTTYLVYGGINPQLSGTVSDRNSCSGTVKSITPGSLKDLEDPRRMRKSASPDFPQGRALILENIDGFPPTPPVFRKSPHFLNLSRTAPYGFSSNIPDLQTFAKGAVTQHLPRTLARNSSGPNPDFRLPTPAELAAMEAFMLAQEFPAGSDPDKFNLNRFATTPAQQRGRDAFFGPAKCSECHGGLVLAQTTVSIHGKPIGINGTFNTGVVNQPINGPGVDNLPCEPAVGTCGSREFNVPQLFNVKNLTPLFHDGSAATVHKAVEFYTSAAFNNSPAGQDIGGISMSAGMIDDITAFLEGLVTGGGMFAISPTTVVGAASGDPVSPAPSVMVVDSNRSPMQGIPVTFTATTNGTVTFPNQLTDSNGIATVGSWILGVGVNTLIASAPVVGSPVLFNGLTNDDFVNRVPLKGTLVPVVTARGSNVGYTTELNEPFDLSDHGTGPSAWWTWTAPCTFSVTQPTSFIDTIGSNFDTVLALFTGSSLTGLQLVAVDDDSGVPGGAVSRIPSTNPGPGVLNITAGTDYQIRVRGFGANSVGNIVLHITTPCGPPVRLVFGQQPSNTMAGQSIAPLVTVRIEDQLGHATASTATVSVVIGNNPGGGTLSGTSTKLLVAGVATFTDLSLDRAAGGYTLEASSPPLTPTISATFSIAPAPPVRLTYGQPPSNTDAGRIMKPPVTVRIEDRFGNLTSSAQSVSLFIRFNPGNATLSGTTTKPAIGGVATFDDLSLDKPAQGYALGASSPGLGDKISPGFNIIDTSPAINDVSQDLAPLFGGPFTLTVNGQNFQQGGVVSIGGVDLVTSFISPTQLTAQVTTSVLSSLGNKVVVVTNPIGPPSSSNARLRVVLHGDINFDNVVNIADALRSALTVGGIVKPSLSMPVGDVNLNGIANIGDALKLALFAGRMSPDWDTPQVTAASPAPVARGGTLTITGTGFAPTPTDNRVSLTTANNGTVRVIPTAGSATSLTVTVPNDAVSGVMQVYRMDTPLGGREFPLVVTGTTTPLTLTAVNPYFQVQPGATVTLDGMGFDPTPLNNVVTFKSATSIVGTLATAGTDTRLTVTVPPGAVCGPITVLGNPQMSNSRTLTIAGTNCGLQLTDILGGGAPGDTLVLEGAGFDTAFPANHIVQFASSRGGTVTAPVLAAGGTQLHVRVPDTAVDGNVTVTLGSMTSNALAYHAPPAIEPSSIDVVVNSANPVGSYQVTISYDKNIVTVNPANVRGGTGAGFTASPFLVNVDNNAGTLTINHFQLGNSPTGQFTVANITFTPVAVGTSSLTLTSRALTDTNGASLPATRLSLGNGTITVGRVP